MTVRTSGPLFSGALARDLDAAVDQAKADVAEAGLNLLHQSAGQFKAPTGYWESQLATDMARDDIVIHDDAVYNAWLEGVSSRNQASRFKGYRMWRQTTQQLDTMAGPIVEQAIRRVL